MSARDAIPKIKSTFSRYELYRILGYLICGYIAIFVSLNIWGSDVTFTQPEGYFNNIANACILVSSIFLATIYAILSILESIKKKTSIDWVFVSIFPLIGIAAGLISLTISIFSDEWARRLLSIALFATIFSLGIVYVVMFELHSLKKERI